jgi:integration host factor subunit alpha
MARRGSASLLRKTDMALTKENIITYIYEQTQMPKTRARDLTETILKIFKNTLSSGEDLLISGFGKFIVKSKHPRRGRNPQTREDLQLRARKVVVFKTSGVLRQKINGPD